MLPIFEGFQNSNLSNGWTIDNPDGDQTWEINSSYGFNSGSSIALENSIYSTNGEYDDLNSPILNFSNLNDVSLSFDYAYSLWTNPNLTDVWSDTLIILISSDCGLTFQKVWEKSGSNLSTTSPVFNGFEWFPSNNNDWSFENINLSNYADQDGIIIKFRNVNQYENNIFLDNINISSGVSFNEEGSISLDRKLLKIVDVLGRKSKKAYNTPQFYIYEDGYVEKKIIKK